jgi:hypothetical protein
MLTVSEGYWPYTEDDLHDYSTFFYTSKAVQIIEESDSSTPFFIYAAFQAVHDPYEDYDEYESGIPKDYVDSDIYDQVQCINV